MSNISHLKQDLSQLKESWATLHKKYLLVEKQHDLETDAARKFSQKSQLEDIKQEKVDIEADISTTEQQLQKQSDQIQLQDLRNELAALRSNKAYQQALDVARQIKTLLPDDAQTAAEVDELQERLEQGKQAQQVFAQLTAHFAELSPIIKELAHILNPRNGSDHMPTITLMAQNFLEQRMKAEDLITACQLLLNPEPHTPKKKCHSPLCPCCTKYSQRAYRIVSWLCYPAALYRAG